MPYLGNQHNVGDHVNNFKVLDDISSHTATFDGSATSVVDTTNNTIRVPLHRFIQGQRVTYTNGGGGNIGGLTTGTAYFVSFDSANTIKLATTLANANSNTVINLSAVGSGTSHTLNAAFDGVNTKFKMTHGSGKAARLNNATQINVAINNVIQRPNLDPNNFTDGFALQDNHKIVFKTAPTVNDIFWGSIIANTIENFDLRDNEVDNFTGDGSTTEFTLSTIPANNESVIVSINGVVQHPSDKNTARSYTLIDSIIQFTAAPALGDGIQVRHIGFAGASTNDVSGFYGRTGNVALTSSDHITTGDITSRNINSSGIITATTFDGAFSSSVGGSNANFTGIVTSGVFKGGDIEGRNLKITGLSTFVGDASFSGNVSIGGTLTYEDVTNIDSVGIITAQSDVHVGAGLSVVGVSTFSGITTVTGNTLFAKQLNVSGVSTFASASYFAGDTRITGSGNIIVGNGSNNGYLSLNNPNPTYSKFYFNGSQTIIQSLNQFYVDCWDGNAYERFIQVHGPNAFTQLGGDIVGASRMPKIVLSGRSNNTGTNSIKLFSSSGTSNNERFDLVDSGITITGLTTFVGNIDANGDLDVDGHTNLDNISIAGVSTFAGAIDLNADLDVDGHTNLDNVSIAGVTTFADNVSIIKSSGPILELCNNTNNTTMALRLHEGVAGSTANGGGMIYNGSSNKLHITCGTNLTTERITIDRDTGNVAIANDLDVDGHTNLDNVSVVGIVTVTGELSVTDDIIAGDEIRNNVATDFWASDNTFINLNGFGNLTHMGGYEINLTSNGYRDTNGQWVGYSAGSNGGAAQIGLKPQGSIVFRTDATKANGSAHNPSTRLTIDDEGVRPQGGILNLRNSGSTGNITVNVLGVSGDSRIDLENTGDGNYSGIDFVRERSSGAGVVGGSIFMKSDTSSNNALMYIQAQSASAQSPVTTALSDSNGVRLLLRGGEGIFSLETGSTEALRIKSNNRTFIHGSGATSANNSGTLLPAGILLNLHGKTSSDGISVVRYSGSYGAYGLNIGRSRNDTFGTNTKVVDGDELGHVTFYGATGSSFGYAAQITGLCDGEVATGGDTTDMPGALSFRTTPDGSDSPTEKLHITSSGEMGLGTGTPPTGSFTIHLTETPEFNLYSTQHAQNNNCKINFGVGQSASVSGNTGARIEMNIPNTGGQMTGELKFHTNVGDNLQERLRITHLGGTVINKGGTINTASGWAALEAKAGSSAHQVVLSSTATASNSNYATLGFKLHPSNDNERVKAAIQCQGNGGGYGEVSRMMFCLDAIADNGNAQGNGDDERFRISPTTGVDVRRDKFGWSTFGHYTGSARTLLRHVKEFGTGSSAATFNLIRVRRHYWGWGHYKITIKRGYYSGIAEDVYYLNGHGRDDGSYSPSYSIGQRQYNGHGSNFGYSNRITITSPSTSSPGSSYAAYVDVRLECPAYMYFQVEVEGYASSYSTDYTSLSSDQYALHP